VLRVILTLPLAYPTPVVRTADPFYQVLVEVGGERRLLHSASIESFKGVEGDFGEATVSFRDFAPGSELLFLDGYPRKGAFSPLVTILCDGDEMGLYIVTEVTGAPMTGWSDLHLRDVTWLVQQALLGQVERTNLVGQFDTWLDVNVEASAGDSVSEDAGVVLVAGDDEANPWRFKEDTLSIGAGEVERTYYATVWVRLPQATPLPPARCFQVTVYNAATDVSTSQYVDITEKTFPRDKWVRLGPVTAVVPVGTTYDLRLSVHATREGEIHYSDPWVVVDEGIGVGPGSYSAQLMALVWDFAAAQTLMGVSALPLTASSLSYPDGQRYPDREHTNIGGIVSGLIDCEWWLNVRGRQIITGGIRTTGSRRTDCTVGTDGRDGNTDTWSSGVEGMASRVIKAAPQSDEAREERAAAVSAEHPQTVFSQADSPDTLPRELGAQAAADLTVAADMTIIGNEVTFGIPPGGTSPVHWLFQRGPNPPLQLCDRIPGRIRQGYADMSKDWRVTSWEVRPRDGSSLKVTVD
jgi:hypothetical protein